MRRRSTPLLITVIVVLVVAIVVLAVFVTQQLQLPGISIAGGTPTPSGTGNGTPVPTFTPLGILHAQGNLLVDGKGHTIILRGAEVDSSFIYIQGWDQGKRPTTQVPYQQTFSVMAHQWNMNVTRIPVSPWIYQKAPTTYMNQLDQYVQAANSNGLYVVLAMHDDSKAGSPYGSSATLPKTEDVTFWKAMASHFKDNPMMIFDLYNEPQEPNWNTWLNGGGTIGGAHIVGFQTLVDAVRSVGAQQLIVVEPGSAGHNAGSSNATTAAEEGGWSNFPAADAIKDPNIMYSLHVYQNLIQPTDQQNVKWGSVLGHYPLFYGEWAFLTNGQGKAASAHCNSLPTDPAQAAQVVRTFMDYMTSIHASWSAWQFAPNLMVQNYTNFTPTTFGSTALQCGSTSADVGMGSVVKQYLTQS